MTNSSSPLMLRYYCLTGFMVFTVNSLLLSYLSDRLYRKYFEIADFESYSLLKFENRPTIAHHTNTVFTPDDPVIKSTSNAHHLNHVRVSGPNNKLPQCTQPFFQKLPSIQLRRTQTVCLCQALMIDHNVFANFTTTPYHLRVASKNFTVLLQ